MVLCSFDVESALVSKNGSHAVTNGTRGTRPFPAEPAAPGVSSAGRRSDAGTSARAASGTTNEFSNSFALVHGSGRCWVTPARTEDGAGEGLRWQRNPIDLGVVKT
jgi:hypothetical protein